MAGFSYVFATKGPLAGRRVLLADADVAAATAGDGWAKPWVPGTLLVADFAAELDPAWVIPGWNAPPAIVDPPVEPPPSPPPSPPPPTEPEPVPVLSLWNTNPALVLVSSANIGKFHNGDSVTMAGVQAPYGFVNGAHTIASVGVGGDQFELVGVDLTAAGSTIGDPGMTATPPAA